MTHGNVDVAAVTCDVCKNGDLEPFTSVQGVPYYRCNICKSLIADKDVLFKNTSKYTREYDESYWSFEVNSSKQRSYGPGAIRVGEVFLLSEIQINNFIDISCGGGYLLDAMSVLMSGKDSMFYGAEPYPPPAEHCSKHPNFHVGYVDDFDIKFDGGTCIEVIEHLFPDTLRSFVERIASVSNEKALYYFNSEQPSMVIQGEFVYLDPYERGHIASYSIAGLRVLFGEYGFTIHEFPGRDWGFFAEYTPGSQASASPFSRLWTPLQHNLATLQSGLFGHLLHSAALDSIRCYLDSATLAERTNWALSLDGELGQFHQRFAQLAEECEKRAEQVARLESELRIAKQSIA